MSYPVALDQHYHKTSHKSVFLLPFKNVLFRYTIFFFVMCINNDAPYAAKLTFIISFNCILWFDTYNMKYI